MVNKEYIDDNISAYSISGTPADCVKIGVEALFKEVNIDMVLSGINNGPNLGTDVIYSGTVSAAIEGFVQNKPSIAFSLNEFNVSKEVYSQVSKHASKIVNDIKDKLNILNDCILNVNIPNGEVKGTKITRLGERKYENVLEERVSPHGKRYFWIGGMTCAACAKAVERVTKKLDGVENSSVNIATEKANIEYDSSKIKISQIKSAIEKAGYSIIEEKKE